MRLDKIKKFLQQAQFFATQMSKDTSSKIGSYFISPGDYTILTQGFNGLPRGANDHLPIRHIRPPEGVKYEYFEHAERNAIYNLARQDLYDSVCVSTEIPSIDCIRALVAVGCRTLYLPFVDLEKLKSNPDLQSLEASQARALELFMECEGELTFTFNDTPLSPSKSFSPTIQHGLNYVKARRAASNNTRHATAFIKGKALLASAISNLESEGFAESSIRMAIFAVARKTLFGSICIATATACEDCAKAIAAVGSKTLVYVRPEPEMYSRWAPSIAKSLAILQKMGVESIELAESDKRPNA